MDCSLFYSCSLRMVEELQVDSKIVFLTENEANGEQQHWTMRNCAMARTEQTQETAGDRNGYG